MSEFKSDNSTARVMKNGVFVGLRFGTYTLVGFFFIPFLSKQFGMGDYSLIALAGFLTQYIGIISGCIGNSIARFINVELNRGDHNQASEIFSTALVSNLVLAAVQIPIYALGIWQLHWLIDFPPELSWDFRVLVACNVIMFLMGTVTGVLYTPLQASNRLDITAKIEVVRQLLQISILYYLITTQGAKLWFIGVVDLGLAIPNMILGIVLYKKYGKSLRFSWLRVSVKWIRPIVGMAGWMMVFVMGQMLFVRTDVWIMNRFVSREMAGIYAVLLVWPNFIRQIGNQLEGLVMPVYMIDYARGNITRVVETCGFLYRSLSYGAALAGGLICGFAPFILREWLGEEFVEYAPLLWLMIFYVVLTLNKAVAWPVFPAFNKVNELGMATLLCGALNLALSIAAAKMGFGAYGVAAVTLGTLFLLFGVLYPWRVSTILKVPLSDFLKCHPKTIALFAAVSVPIALVPASESLGLKVGVAILVLCAGTGVVWMWFYNDQDRSRVLTEVGKIWRKVRKGEAEDDG